MSHLCFLNGQAVTLLANDQLTSVKADPERPCFAGKVIIVTYIHDTYETFIGATIDGNPYRFYHHEILEYYNNPNKFNKLKNELFRKIKRPGQGQRKGIKINCQKIKIASGCRPSGSRISDSRGRAKIRRAKIN